MSPPRDGNPNADQCTAVLVDRAMSMARRLLVRITFSREHAKQQLPINKMMSYLLTSSTPFIEEIELMHMAQMSQSEWQTIADGNYSVLFYFVKQNPHESGRHKS